MSAMDQAKSSSGIDAVPFGGWSKERGTRRNAWGSDGELGIWEESLGVHTTNERDWRQIDRFSSHCPGKSTETSPEG